MQLFLFIGSVINFSLAGIAFYKGNLDIAATHLALALSFSNMASIDRIEEKIK